MRIRELPIRLKELALQRMEQSGKLPDDNIFLISAFGWSETPEGNRFWSSLDDDNFEIAKKCRPDLAYLFEDSIDAMVAPLGWAPPATYKSIPKPSLKKEEKSIFHKEEPMLKINLRKK